MAAGTCTVVDELLGIGPLITLACLSSLVVLAAPGGTAAVTAAIAAALAQLYLLIWAGKTVAALAAGCCRPGSE